MNSVGKTNSVGASMTRNIPSGKRRVLIVGCGYLGIRIANVLATGGDELTVITRSVERANEFENYGWQPIVADLTRAALDNKIEADSVLFAMGIDADQRASAQTLWQQALEHLIQSVTGKPDSFVYISSTGVFGDCQGQVDEASPCRPNRPTAQAHLAMEDWIQESPWSESAIVLRIGGLYGPDRLPNAVKIHRAEPLPTDPQHDLNLIHVDDAARVAVSASSDWQTPDCVIVTDGEPVTRGDFYASVAELIGAEPPTFMPVGKNDRKSASHKRRIRSQRHAKLIQPLLVYPTFREGLAAICHEHRKKGRG